MLSKEFTSFVGDGTTAAWKCRLVSSSSLQSVHRGSSILLNKARCWFTYYRSLGRLVTSQSLALITYHTLLATHVSIYSATATNTQSSFFQINILSISVCLA